MPPYLPEYAKVGDKGNSACGSKPAPHTTLSGVCHHSSESIMYATVSFAWEGHMSEVTPVPLSPRNKQILLSYIPVLDGLAEYLGSGYEIVLHSLEDFDHSAIKVIHGEHTGRTEGAPITDLALDMLERIQRQRHTNHICYFTTNGKGDPLKSTTIIIRGVEGEPIGLLCINFYLNTPLSDCISLLSANNDQRSEHFEQNPIKESLEDRVNRLVAHARTLVENDPHVLPSLRNREIIAILNDEGIFQIKESVALVAQALSISKGTVYLHLRTLREQDAQ